MIDKTVLKMTLILLAIQLVATFKNNTTRYIIREWFTKGELQFWKWFNPNFLFNLSFKQIFGLAVIASFTLITFPLGIWLGSFSLAKSYPIINMVGAILNLTTFPITLYLMNNVLNEFEYNGKTALGIALIILSKLIIILGCWLMYKGGLE